LKGPAGEVIPATRRNALSGFWRVRAARSRSMKTTLVIACPADTAFAKLVPASPKIGRMIATNVGI
jgi:hypothetical protein